MLTDSPHHLCFSLLLIRILYFFYFSVKRKAKRKRKGKVNAGARFFNETVNVIDWLGMTID